MRIIRASEIGRYLYCKRSWSYYLKGFTPANTRELTTGTELHTAHGRRVASGIILRILSILLFIIAFIILAALLVN